MKKTLIIIFILFFALAAGFYFGFRNRPVEFIVHEQAADGTIEASSTTFLVGASQLQQSGAIKPLLNPDYQKQTGNLPWYITRAAAITAFVLMFFVIFWGTGMTTGYIYRFSNPVEAWVVHKYISIGMGVMVLVHMVSLLFDKYMNFSLWQLFVPYASAFKPIYLSLGIIGFYLLVLIIFSSLLARLSWPKFWRGMHYLVYPLFIISLVHGLYTGSDSGSVALQSVYWVTGSSFLLLVAYRFIYLPIKNKN